MAGDHFTGGDIHHVPIPFLEPKDYDIVERNIVYACTDVVPRDPTTGKIFLGTRQTEPQPGPWVIGGRNVYGEGVSENAAFQMKQDVGLDIRPGRFRFLAAYSTSFPVAGPGREDHGRHSLNSTMLVDLKPEEVALLNQNVMDGKMRDEYSGGDWYDPKDIADKESSFPDAMKQLIRDLNDHDKLMSATIDDAKAENNKRFPTEFGGTALRYHDPGSSQEE